MELFDNFEKSGFTIPTLIFKTVKNKVKGDRSYIELIGVAVPCLYKDGTPAYTLTKTNGVDNYEFSFRILDTGEEDLRPWLSDLVERFDESDHKSPAIWKDIDTLRVIDQTQVPKGNGSAYNFLSFLSERGFYYDARLVEDFLLGLKVKPFMLFCGGTGTGKTQLTTLYVDYLNEKNNPCKKLIVPVGSNWTENRHIIGYYNLITKEYVDQPANEFVLEANKNPGTPYFLILDEMNLSHVERYFSDFLSAMETKEKEIRLNHRDEGKEKPENSIKLTDNLFVIGTMNVDETTYSVSPKVLDRANVIRFEKANVENYLKSSIIKGEFKDNYEFLEDCMSSIGVREMKGPTIMDVMRKNGFEDCEGLVKSIDCLQQKMDGIKLPLGYRTVDEILRFIYVAGQYEGWNTFDWKRYMDDQILMKVIPKIHGDNSIAAGLKSLKKFLEGDIEKSKEDDFGKSKKVIEDMVEMLENRRYVSYIG